MQKQASTSLSLTVLLFMFLFFNSLLEDLVGHDGETSGLRDLCVRRARPFGGADAMKEVFVE